MSRPMRSTSSVSPVASARPIPRLRTVCMVERPASATVSRTTSHLSLMNPRLSPGHEKNTCSGSVTPAAACASACFR